MPREPDQLKNSQNQGLGYKLACVLLLLSIALYATSLTMNVARVEGRVKINNNGGTEMVDEVVSKMAKELDLSELINTQLTDALPLDQVSDEITGLIREYVWKLKKQASSAWNWIWGQIKDAFPKQTAWIENKWKAFLFEFFSRKNIICWINL